MGKPATPSPVTPSKSSMKQVCGCQFELCPLYLVGCASRPAEYLVVTCIVPNHFNNARQSEGLGGVVWVYKIGLK